jgi:hypothetical protein
LFITCLPRSESNKVLASSLSGWPGLRTQIATGKAGDPARKYLVSQTSRYVDVDRDGHNAVSPGSASASEPSLVGRLHRMKSNDNPEYRSCNDQRQVGSWRDPEERIVGFYLSTIALMCRP